MAITISMTISMARAQGATTQGGALVQGELQPSNARAKEYLV